MKRFLSIVLSVVLVSCATGLDKQMGELLDRMESDLGYVNTNSDEEVAKVADWFVRHGDDNQKARAFYCLARNQYNSRNYSASIVSNTRALQYADDTLTVAKICYDMAHTNGATMNSADEILYLSRAAEAFKAAGYPSEAQKALLEIGEAQSGLGQDKEAERIFSSVLADAHEMKDTLLEARCLEAYAALLVSKDTLDPVLAIDMLRRAADDLGYPLSCEDKGILAYSYSLVGEDAEARKWLSAAKSSAETEAQSAGVSFREYQIESRAGNSAKALAALERVTEYGDEAQTSALREATAATQREYIQEQAQAISEQLRSARLRLWVLGLAAVLALVAVAAVYYFHRLEEEKKLEQEKADKDRYMTIAEEMQSRLNNVSKGRFDTLERLCEQYYVYEGTENLQPKILKEVKSIVDGLRNDRKAQKDLEDMLNQSKNDVMKKLREEFPSWKEEDFLLYSFAAAGLSSTTISTLMEKEKGVIYNRIWRLKGRISGSESALRDFFLECLSK